MKDFFTTNKSAIVSSNRVLYTPSSFAKSSLLHLQEIGELTAQRPHVSSRSGLRSYLFFMVLSGSGSLNYEGKEYDLKRGDCVFIDCQKPYSHSTAENDLWSLQWVHFYGPTLYLIYDKYIERGGQSVFSPPSMDKIQTIWESLMGVAKGIDYMKDMFINQYLSELLVCIMSESWHPEYRTTTPKKQNLSNIRDYLDNHYSERITLDDLANQFYVDKYYLTKIFKEQFGQSVNTYLANIRITKAKQLLRFSNMTVEEIGYEVGIGAPAYFSRVFKNIEGISPKQFREQW